LDEWFLSFLVCFHSHLGAMPELFGSKENQLSSSLD
jgi:hypothetical protein